MNLYWQAKTTPTEDYHLSLELFDQNEQPVIAWSKALAPENHPLHNWQPGEIVTIPFPLELNDVMPANIQRATLSVVTDNPTTAPVIIDVSHSFNKIMLAQVQPNFQHRLERVTFGEQLDLLGYDLEARNNAQAEGSLFVKLHWLNRQPINPLEAQVEVLDAEGKVIAHQLLPVPSPSNAFTWRSTSNYELLLTTLPDSLIIKVKPKAQSQWLTTSGQATDAIVIDHLLNKTAIVQN